MFALVVLYRAVASGEGGDKGGKGGNYPLPDQLSQTNQVCLPFLWPGNRK